jgi:hypothetical protein
MPCQHAALANRTAMARVHSTCHDADNAMLRSLAARAMHA